MTLALSLAIFAVTYGLIVSEKVDRTAAAILGATAMVMLHLIPHSVALEHVDLDVMFLLTGMMIVVGILSETGLFEWVAIFIARRAQGNALIILIGLLTATAVLSAFLDNVTTVVLIAPITILLTQILDIPTIPFLVLQALFSNIGGTATLIGDPPNILIASKSGLNFNQFIFHLLPAVLLVMWTVLIFIAFTQKNLLRTTPAARLRIMQAHPELAITDPVRLKRGLAVFALIIFGFCVGHYFHIEPGIVALAGGFLMLVVCGAGIHGAMEKVEWETIFFLIGLFILVGTLEHVGVFAILGDVMFRTIGHNLPLLAVSILWISGVLSAVFGNIPVVIAFLPLVKAIIPAYFAPLGGVENADPLLVSSVADPLWWSLALGSCLGGNGTLFGAAANVVVAQIAKKNGYHISFLTYLRYGLPVTIASLCICTVYVYLRYFAFVRFS
ncbi:MAG: ArsB/NhaD family transporter [Candidatus Hydrogenedentes bacterium]|nr:ArsB/NhaD family transporter [Candidatus Hydrogenedentota bacterium]